jgi:signal transduction histidine kinase
MDIRNEVSKDRQETDERLREERDKTDRLLQSDPMRHVDDALDEHRVHAEQRLRQARGAVDAHLDRQAEILPRLTETLEDVANSLTTAANSLTGVADTLKESSGAVTPPAGAVANLSEAAEGVAAVAADIAGAGGAPLHAPAEAVVGAADAPVELVGKLAEIAGGIAGVAADLDAERQAADTNLRNERTLTDQILTQTIEQTESALVADLPADRGLLATERRATDKELATERRHTDAAMDKVLETLVEEQAAHGVVRREIGSRKDFLAMISHDLRGPIASVSIGATLLIDIAQETSQEKRLTEIAESILQSAAVMERLVRDLLDSASSEDGRLRVAAQPHDIREIVRRAVDVFLPMAAAKSIVLEEKIPSEPVTAVFDPNRMLQVISNLLQNAIKFTPEGGTIRVRAARAGRECLIAISDNGVGIAETQMSTIFDRFKQIQPERGGLGLGLYISKWIVEAHGGRIWVDSRPGGGSTFYVTLPELRTEN